MRENTSLRPVLNISLESNPTPKKYSYRIRIGGTRPASVRKFIYAGPTCPRLVGRLAPGSDDGSVYRSLLVFGAKEGEEEKKGMATPRRNEEELGRNNNKKKKKMSGKETEGQAKWPSIKPKKDLQINRLKGTHLFTIPNFFTASEAKAFVEIAESLGFTHQGSRGPAYGEAYRDNDRISVSDPVLAESMWEAGLKRIFDEIKLPGKLPIGLNPNIRFYRYKVGQLFGQHIDESVDLGEGRKTQYTLLIYLSGISISKAKKDKDSSQDSSLHSLGGGETVFYDKRHGVAAEVAPVAGMALLHIHGAKCMLHEARAVTKNIKYVLRSDVVFA